MTDRSVVAGLQFKDRNIEPVRIATDHREAILQNAARLFARRPFHEVLMDDVAVQVGIAKGTIYRYFPNKAELFVALSMRFVAMLGEEVGKSISSDDPVENLRCMVARMGAVIDENRDFFQIMQRRECEVWERKSPEFLQVRNVLRDLFVDQIRAAERAGILTCPFGQQAAADMLLGMVRNILRFSIPVPQPDVLAEMVTHVFLNGLRQRPK
jgi:AcrR family transcriptional regulator